jgi:predicted nuclease of predicted toxin-antitoxin system
MTPRNLLVDACTAPAVVERLRADGHDVAHAFDTGPDISDAALLAFAAREGRIIVTIDKDFGALVFRDGLSRVGVLRIREAKPAAQAQRASELIALYGGELEAGAFVVDDGDTARVRPKD